MSRPAVSVIIPTFNRVELLRRALDSLQRQTVSDFETIIVDDGSTEDIAALATSHPTRPTLVRQNRAGPAAARNRGAAEAKADLIAFLDSDDEWLPTKLERYLAAIAAQPATPVWYGPMSPIDADGNPVPGRTKPCHPGRITRQLFESSFVHVPTVIIRRDVFDAFGGFNPQLRVCEDYDLWLRISTKHEFGLIPEPLALRRLHAHRLSKSCMRRNLAVKAGVLERFYRDPKSATLLDGDSARRRLARVMLAAARSALRDRHPREADAWARRASEYGASPWRVGRMITLATLARLIGLDRAAEEPCDEASPIAHQPVATTRPIGADAR